MNKKALKTHIFLISVVLSPIVISSCAASQTTSLDSIKDFLDKNQDQIIQVVDKSVLEVPTLLYTHKKSPKPIKDYFKINDNKEFTEKLNGIKINFEYDTDHPRDSIKFKITFNSQGKNLVYFSVIDKFKNEDEYLRYIRNDFFGSMQLIDKTKTLKDFIKNNLPNEDNLNEWEKLLDYDLPLGFTLSFQDIETNRFDSVNNKIKIGTFNSEIFDLNISTNDINLSIEKSFKTPNKPLFIFMVDSNGVAEIDPIRDINAEVIFINRTETNIIEFKQTWNRKAIFGELDFSQFNDWLIPSNVSTNLGFFSNNFITCVKFPKKIKIIKSKLFLLNKISIIDIPNSIISIENDSFDKKVKFNNLENLENLNIYLDKEKKHIDFSRVVDTKNLTFLLNLISKKSESLLINDITLPSSLLGDDVPRLLISEINNLDISVNNLFFSSLEISDETVINDELIFSSWKIIHIDIPETVLSINMDIKTETKSRILNRKIVNTVVNGVLKLNEDLVNIIPKYFNKLNNYFSTGNISTNIIKELHLENNNPTNQNFDKIFIEPLSIEKNKIVISEKTLFCSDVLVSNIKNNYDVTRITPENIVFTNGELVLNMDIFNIDFYRQIVFLPKIRVINFDSTISRIPSKAFFDIDLSSTVINFNNIQEIDSYAFYKSNLGDLGQLKLMNVKKIGNYAFQSNKLTSIDLPNVTNIGAYAFANNEIILSNTPRLDIIGEGSFQNNKLTSIELFNITIIPNNSFKDNEISFFDLPNVTNIGAYSFQNNKLTSIDLPNVVDIGAYSFQNNQLISIVFPKIKKINDFAFHKNFLTSIDLNSLQSIGDSTFRDNQLNRILLTGVTSIGSKAFWENINLKNVNLSSNTVIKKDTFTNSVKIKVNNFVYENLYIENEGKKIIDFRVVPETDNFSDVINQLQLLINDENTIIDILYFSNLNFQSGLSLNIRNVKKINKLIINENVTKISDYIFDNVEIEEVVGLETVDRIGNYAFRNSKIEFLNDRNNDLMRNLRTTKLLLKLESIGSSSFEGNLFTEVQLEPLAAADGKKFNIPIRAFFNNVRLTNAKIPALVTDVHENAFTNWNIVDRIHFDSPSNDWTYKDGILFFSKISNDAIGIQSNIRKLNGLKITKIEFKDDIYVIPKDFLFNLKISNQEVEIDLTNILVIEEKAFSSTFTIRLSDDSTQNLIYNDSNSGIVV
ncbi:MAG: leucine-rich repeat protein [Mycoplasmataceae bacterium]|nr:leucine-rich repeat protein [Mycoplasmataceae bacterium]